MVEEVGLLLSGYGRSRMQQDGWEETEFLD